MSDDSRGLPVVEPTPYRSQLSESFKEWLMNHAEMQREETIEAGSRGESIVQSP